MTRTRKPKKATTTEERIAKETPVSVIATEEEVMVTFDVDICIYCGGYYHTTDQAVRVLYSQGACTCVMCMTCDKRMLVDEQKVTNNMGSFCLGCAFGFA